MKYVTGHYVNLIACGLYISLFVAGLYLGGFSSPLMYQLISILIVVALLAFAFNFWRYLAIAKAPISTIHAAAQGYIELNGIATKHEPLHTPLHGQACVWYRSWTYSRDHEQLWRLADFKQSDAVFQITDSTGTCSVNPKGAEVIYTVQKTSNNHNHRYVEEYLPADESIYLIGYLDTRHHFSDPQKIKADIGELITHWKSNPVKMLFRFDLDRNGKIDHAEWEKARAEARQEVERKQNNLAHHGDFEVKAPSKCKLYMLSGKSPQLLRASYRFWVITHLVVLLCLSLTANLF